MNILFEKKKFKTLLKGTQNRQGSKRIKSTATPPTPQVL